MSTGRKKLGALKKQREDIILRYKRKEMTARETVWKLNDIDKQITDEFRRG